MSNFINGKSVYEGIGIGRVYMINELDLSFKKIRVFDPKKEIEKFNEAIEVSIKQINKIKMTSLKHLGHEKNEVFNAHIMVLQDPELKVKVVDLINLEKCNAEYAVLEIRNEFLNIFHNFEDNEYMKERSIDILDTTNRIIANLTNQKLPFLDNINEDVIIVANNLNPSDAAQLNTKFVKGIVTNIGGVTSHSSIIAKSLKIPCMIGVKDVVFLANDGDLVAIDSINEKFYLTPNEDDLKNLHQLMDKLEKENNEIREFTYKETLTSDNFKTKILANISNQNDSKLVHEFGAEGVGLFRSEFIYINNDDFPTEEEQFEIYKEVLTNLQGKPAVIRTLDIGGDKDLDYINFDFELNPFLGERAIRFSLKRKEIFITQLRALLKASPYGNLKIMFPMISVIEEFLSAKKLLLEVKDSLIKEGIKVSENIEVGMMVEVPSAAILADRFAKIVDFFSIGTNDLTQYTFAADRLNSAVAYLYQPLHPSMIRLMKNVVTEAHKHGKWVGVCGEVASTKEGLMLFIGLKIDELSMSLSSINESRFKVSQMNQSELEALVEKALELDDEESVKQLFNSILN